MVTQTSLKLDARLFREADHTTIVHWNGRQPGQRSGAIKLLRRAPVRAVRLEPRPVATLPRGPLRGVQRAAGR